MLEIMVIAVCLFLNAFFAAYEMAFVSVPRPELRSAARKGSKIAQRILLLREHPERTLSIIQIGITMVGAIAAAVGGAGAAENIEPMLLGLGLSVVAADLLAVLIVVTPITYLSVVVGELVPKTLALRNPMKITLAGAPILFLADRIFSPIVTVLEGSTKQLLRIFFKKEKVDESAVQTTIELDSFSPVHQTLMLNMADIEKKKISEILLPWKQVNSVQKSDSIEHVTQVVFNSGHTRLPVTDNDHVVGILHTKEFVTLKDSGEKNWQAIVRTPLKVLATDSALGVLRLLQEKRSHMALVFSPTGEHLGIVTMEDILEEVVGDIFDEDDDGKVRRVFAARARSRVFSGS